MQSEVGDAAQEGGGPESPATSAADIAGKTRATRPRAGEADAVNVANEARGESLSPGETARVDIFESTDASNVCEEGGKVQGQKTDSRHAAKRKAGGSNAIVEDTDDGDSEDDRPLLKKAAADPPSSERGGNVRAALLPVGAETEEDKDAGSPGTQQTSPAAAPASHAV